MYLLLVFLMIASLLNGAHRENALTVTHEPIALNLDDSDTPSAIAAGHAISNIASGEDLCEVALSIFMKRTDSDLAKYIKPHLKSVIQEATSSPDSDDDNSPSPKRIIKSWVRKPDSVKNTPRDDMDEVVLAAVQKAFEEKEALIQKKEKKIEGMFSKKSTALITTVVSALVTITSSLGSVYGTKLSENNCTK